MEADDAALVLVFAVILAIAYVADATISGENVQNSIDKGVAWLKGHQLSDGSIVYGNDAKWRVWDTANAALAFLENGDYRAAGTALNYVLGRQNPDGSFSPYSNIPYADVETTSVAVLALYHYNNKTVTPEISKALQFLLVMQEPDGGWTIGNDEYVAYDKQFPSVSCYASLVLSCTNYSYDKHGAVQFILSAQERSGSWGVSDVYYSTFFYPISVCSSLLARENNTQLSKTLGFLVSSQDFDGGWGMLKFGKFGTIRREIDTALAVNALLSSPYYDNKVLKNGVRWLLRAQASDGRWKGGHLAHHADKDEDVYATAHAVIALSKYQKFLRNAGQNGCY